MSCLDCLKLLSPTKVFLCQQWGDEQRLAIEFLVIQQVFIVHLLNTQDCARHWAHSGRQQAGTLLLTSVVGAAPLGVSWGTLMWTRGLVSGPKRPEPALQGVQRRAGFGRKTRALGSGTCKILKGGWEGCFGTSAHAASVDSQHLCCRVGWGRAPTEQLGNPGSQE